GFPPGRPRQLVMTSTGILNGAVREVSGLTALPSPEFWNRTAAGRPPSSAPQATATASPSLAAATYSTSGASITTLISGASPEHGVPENSPNPQRRSSCRSTSAWIIGTLPRP